MEEAIGARETPAYVEAVSMITVYSADWVLPVTSPPLRDGALAVEDGQIIAVGEKQSVIKKLAQEAVEDRSFSGSLILPGLINAHTHLELTCLRGKLEDLPFFRWIESLVAQKQRLTASELLASAKWGALEAIRSGVTTVGEIVDSGASVVAIAESGLRAVAFQEIYDLQQGTAEKALSLLESRLAGHRRIASSRMTIGVSPHSTWTVSRELFEALAAKSPDDGFRLAIHAAESRDEVAFLRDGTGTIADYFQTRGLHWQLPGVSPVAYLDSLGVLETKPLLIHVVHADDRDIEAIEGSGAAVAHCPKSNAKLGHGVAPVCRMIAAGVTVGLGTDSMASNNACDLFDEARFALLMQRAIDDEQMCLTAKRILEMATIEGARALELDRETGSLETGKRADFIAVTLREPDLVRDTSLETALVFGASSRDVRFVAVDGETLYEDGGFPRFDEDQLRRDFASAARRSDQL